MERKRASRGAARVPETHGFRCRNVSLNTIPCAGIDLQPYQIGVRSIELVIADIHRNKYGMPETPCNTSMPSRLVEGPALPRLPLDTDTAQTGAKSARETKSTQPAWVIAVASVAAAGGETRWRTVW